MSAALRIVDGEAVPSSAWPIAPGEAPKAIGPDYAAIRSRNWARVHILADRREPIYIAPVVGRRI